MWGCMLGCVTYLFGIGINASGLRAVKNRNADGVQCFWIVTLIHLLPWVAANALIFWPAAIASLVLGVWWVVAIASLSSQLASGAITTTTI